MDIKGYCYKAIAKMLGSLAQDESARQSVEKVITPGMPGLLREVAADGAILLENRILPYKKEDVISVFGRTQIDYFYTGYGSGGDVNAPYKTSLLEGLQNCSALKLNKTLADGYQDWTAAHPVDHGSWGKWPHFYPEMPLSDAAIDEAARDSNQALIVIGRSSGEDRDCLLEKGSFYLTDEELTLIRQICTRFTHPVILLNIGCIIDMSWVAEFKDQLGALMIVWQGGMESGNAVADLLCGNASPSGRLSDTIAKTYQDYPSADYFGNFAYNDYQEDIFVGYRWFETFAKDRVLYPFGYGLSYSDFKVTLIAANETETAFDFTVRVENLGTHDSKHAVCLYLNKPCKKLGNPARELAAFAKTKKLAAGKSETLLLSCQKKQLASYDADGRTGHKSCYVIEQGHYRFSLGGDIRSAEDIHSVAIAADTVAEQLSEAGAPRSAFEIITAVEKDGKIIPRKVPVPLAATDTRATILNHLPKDIPLTDTQTYQLIDVKNKKVDLDRFVAQLSLTELEAITRGDYTMDSPLGAKGNAAVCGGVLASLRAKGIPPVTVCDGPSGVRLLASCSLIPIGTLLASTFDTDLIARLYHALGEEVKLRGSSVLLAPGLNIHRNPLCGRNFEYYSEDPYLTGMIAAASVKGLQGVGVSACPKHFACNNQEYNRSKNDSRLSERALREIYLKAFEICVKEAKPMTIMTSYNKINGVWGHYHYELCTLILRHEWKYEGCVMTDWWMKHSQSPEFPALKDNAYRIRSQVDLLMPGGWHFRRSRPDGTLLKTYGKKDGITLGEMQRCAKNVLQFVMDSAEFEHIHSKGEKS